MTSIWVRQNWAAGMALVAVISGAMLGVGLTWADRRMR
jgi:hypothetical protein